MIPIKKILRSHAQDLFCMVLQHLLAWPEENKSAVKRRSTLGGLDQYTTPNTLEMSAPPPPQKKKKKKNSSSLWCHVKFQTTNTSSSKNCHTVCETVTLSLWNSLRSTHPTNWVWRVTWKLAHYLSDVTGSSTAKSVTGGYFQIPFVWHVH